MNSKILLVPDNPMARGPRAAYIHIPFCRKKCGYCDFYSFVAGPEQIEAYVQAVVNEITYMSSLNDLFEQRERLDSVYFGGGTPGLLEASQVQRILSSLDFSYGLHDDCEITMEANPDSADAQKFLDYRAAGVNRLSLGVQSLNDDLLKRLERLHDAETARAAIKKAKRSGFRNLSVDLMIGLPGQKFDDFAVDLDFLLKEDIPHFSVYSLGIEKNTPFYERYFQESKSGEPSLLAASEARHPLYAPLPEAEEERSMYHFCREYMKEEGYKHYEVSNFAKPGYESRHNQVYWRAEPYWGFGVAAASYVAGRRCLVTRDFDKYLRFFDEMKAIAVNFSVKSGLMEINPYYEEEWVVDRAEAMREFFLLGLRLRDGVSLSAFRTRFKEDPPLDLLQNLAELITRGLLVFTGAEGSDEINWRLSVKGLDFGNEVFRAFV